jgi:hypothetical protein
MKPSPHPLSDVAGEISIPRKANILYRIEQSQVYKILSQNGEIFSPQVYAKS